MFVIQRLSSWSHRQCCVHRHSKEALWSLFEPWRWGELVHAWTLSFTAVVGNSAPLPCWGASHLCSAAMLGWSAPLLLGWSSPMFTFRVCDLCRVRVDVWLSHPLPSVVTAPVCRGCLTGTQWSDPVTRDRPDESANSCWRAGVFWRVVHVVLLCLWKVWCLRLSDSLSENWLNNFFPNDR